MFRLNCGVDLPFNQMVCGWESFNLSDGKEKSSSKWDIDLQLFGEEDPTPDPAPSGAGDPDPKLPDPELKPENDYLDHEWAGLKYNKASFEKAKDYYFQAGCQKVEKSLQSGKHTTLKLITPEQEDRLKRADEYEEALGEMKKGNQLDPEKYNVKVVKELDTIKKREKETTDSMQKKYDDDMTLKVNEIAKMRNGIVQESISSRLRPQIVNNENKDDKGLQLLLKAAVTELSNQVELQEDFSHRVFEIEDGERKYISKTVDNKSVHKTLDDLVNEFISSSPMFAAAKDLKSGGGTKFGGKGGGDERPKLMSWEGKDASKDWEPRPGTKITNDS